MYIREEDNSSLLETLKEFVREASGR
jgi:hypothetical protein